jgi:malate dehydrogenase (oxaloacetate-decarboxylating)(NADP+)
MLVDQHQGIDLLHTPSVNKGTAFTDEERDHLHLRGLLPPRVFTLEEQTRRVYANFKRKPTDMEKYIYLIGLQERNETLFYHALFYHVVHEHLAEMMPILYTPTVGQACLDYGRVFRRPHGLFITRHDKGHIADILHNWYHDDVRVIVVTDGERILGLGDLGAQGMGIPVGKLTLYTACAGIHPTQCLPITLDVGTDNEDLRRDPDYIGLAEPRLRGAAYHELLEEFMLAAHRIFPRAVIQLEDFGNSNAFHLLRTYRERVCTFDDDIQGTAAVTLAGILSALKLKGSQLKDEFFLFLGAGEAGIGIGELIVAELMAQRMNEAQARERCWFFDSKGLVVKARTDLAEHKRPFAHDYACLYDFQQAVEQLKPTAIIGVSGQPHSFTRGVLEAMGRNNVQPIIFALSNPTSKSECSAEQAYLHTHGRAIFASGSPFPSVTLNGITFVPGQANNAYVFPGIGLGLMAVNAEIATDEMFSAAARTLAKLVTPDDLAQGRIYPALERIREVSLEIAVAVAKVAYARGIASEPEPADLYRHIREMMYEPVY